MGIINRRLPEKSDLLKKQSRFLGEGDYFFMLKNKITTAKIKTMPKTKARIIMTAIRYSISIPPNFREDLAA